MEFHRSFIKAAYRNDFSSLLCAILQKTISVWPFLKESFRYKVTLLSITWLGVSTLNPEHIKLVNCFMHNVEKWPCFKNLVVFIPQGFYSISGHVSTLCMKRLICVFVIGNIRSDRLGLSVI